MPTRRTLKQLSALKRTSRYREQTKLTSRRMNLEQLEDRRVMATGPTLVTLLSNNGVIPDGPVGLNNIVKTAPRELTLRFAEGQSIDPSTIANGIKITRSNLDNTLGNANDLNVAIGSIAMGDVPREVVVRFARNLPDDLYRVTLVGAGTSPLKDTFGNPVNGGVDLARDFNLDLGAQVLSVVPQPITRNATTGALTQSANTIDVYFNADTLDMATAQNRAFYRLIDTTTGNVTLPTGVALDAISGKATLTFATAVASGTYKLQVGTVDEPNDTILGAVHIGGPLAISSKYLGDNPTLVTSFNDVDLYRFDLKADVANFNVALQAGSGFDGALRLFDAAGNPVGAFSNATGVGQAETLTRSLTAGTYYVGVSSTGNVTYTPGTGAGATGGTTQGSYSLNVSFTNAQGIENGGNDSAFTSANDAGVLGIGGAQITAAIDAQVYTIAWPGAMDDPGHRQLPPAETGETHLLGGADTTGGTVIRQYNFKKNLGPKLAGGTYFNSITPDQKQRAREIFELYGRYAGVKFVETDFGGMTVATGELQAIDPTFPDGAAGGLAGNGLAVMNNGEDWGKAEYGGAWFNVAMHEIGHLLGLGHSYDLPGLTIQGSAETGSAAPGNEPVFPGDHDITHLQTLYRPDTRDIDLYKFTLAEAGRFTAETIAERLSNTAGQNTSQLNSVLTLYRETSVGGVLTREVVATNDDYFSSDSQIQLDLTAGVYYIGVTAQGMTGIDPRVSNSGLGGMSDGPYQLKFDFLPAAGSSIIDVTGSKLDGNLDGIAGGTFEFFFQANNAANTIYVDKVVPNAPTGAVGSITNPYRTIEQAITAAREANQGVPGSVAVIRVAGGSSTPYLIGYKDDGSGLADGVSLAIPKDVTMMIDAGAIFKLQNAYIEVGTSASLGLDQSNAALQVLGTPTNKVNFTSYHDDTLGGDSDGPAAANLRAGNWGGIVFRSDSDREDKNIFLNIVNQADIRYGGGEFPDITGNIRYAPIHTESARPTITFNRILDSASAAISADPNSFAEALAPKNVSFSDVDSRIGLKVYGNILANNSVNGLFVRIRTNLGAPIDVLTVAARFDDTDIVHVITENLFINGTPGGAIVEKINNVETGRVIAQEDARLRIDPGIIVKMEGARIEARMGGQLIAEGSEALPIVFTSLRDDRFGIGGTFDTNNNANDPAGLPASPGNWGGLFFLGNSSGSIDRAKVYYAGGETDIEGETDITFNPIEIHEADVRITNSLFQFNADGTGSGGIRNGRGVNGSATIYVRGAQPIIVNNIIRDNVGQAISINANSLRAEVKADYGRSTGNLEAFTQYADNFGPLVRANRLIGNGTNGMQVRGAVLTTESVWDDTDIAHVVRDEISILNQHVYGGLRLQSSTTESLVVKLNGPTAGFVANGQAMEIDDRIGGTIHILGQPGRPVVLTALADDTVSAGSQPITGLPLFDTNGDGSATTPVAGAWNSIRMDKYSNDRNVAVAVEAEKAFIGTTNNANGSPTGDANRNPGANGTSQFLGNLAPNQKSGDENRRLGFEVDGNIALDNSHDVDVYSFTGDSGTEIWLDIDRTGFGLNAMVELIDAAGFVFYRSRSETDFGLVDYGSSTPNLSVSNYQKNVVLGRDFYTTNVNDPIMRATLPGNNLKGATYYVRVRSEPTAAQIGNINQGQTSGEYQLQLRLQQADEKPGSTVRYADVRYATNGIEVIGLPYHSFLSGESAEGTNDNGATGNAPNIGNLLTSDQATVAVSGSLSSSSDVDFYTFNLDYDFMQVIGGVSDAAKTVSAIFDIDYADGLSRPDTTISVFDAQRRLIFVGRDSDVIDDQAAVGQGNDVDDLTRGTSGKLDAYIGAAQLPAGSVLAGSRQYYVAVSSNRQLPTALNAQFQANAASPLIRLEPVTSVRRIVEDHIGFIDGSLLATDASNLAGDEDGQIFKVDDKIELATHIRTFNMSDTVLFTGSSGGLVQHDGFTGATEVGGYGGGSNQIADIHMRNDGRMFGFRRRPNDIFNAGELVEFISATNSWVVRGTDNIQNLIVPPDPDPDQLDSPGVEAFAYTGDAYINYGYSLYLSATGAVDPLSGRQVSKLFFADPENGNVRDGNGPLGAIGNIVPNNVTTATGVVSFGTVSSLTYSALTPGAAGNGIEIVFKKDALQIGQLPVVNVDVPNGTIEVTLNTTVSNASASTNLGTAANFTFAARATGPQGNGIQVVIQKGINVPSGASASVAGRTIIVTIDQASATAGQLISAIQANAAANALITATTDSVTAVIGPSASPQTVTIAGGGPSSAQDVADAIAASPQAQSLITLTGSSGTLRASVVDTFDPEMTVNFQAGSGTVSLTTGMIFLNGTMYGVNEEGDFFTINLGSGRASPIKSFNGTHFTGLTVGPQNVDGGAYKDMLFATTTNGTVLAFDIAGNLQNVFAGNTFSAPVGFAEGLAFSPLDFNLWHTTQFRGGEAGHGINSGTDNGRSGVDGEKSFYFGLESWTDGDTYDKMGGVAGTSDAQLGVLTSGFQQRLANAVTHPAMANSYNFLGGAYGELESDSFSLVGYAATDKPTVYFNYWLQTEDAASINNGNMRDAARVWISRNGGSTWELVATNNGQLDNPATLAIDGELATFKSTSSTEMQNNARQKVQELYDVASWRQGRVDLSRYAGQSNLSFRFDFGTSGVTGAATLEDGFGDFSSPGRGQRNNFGGFMVDDIIVGFAERGEMATGGSANIDTFFATPVPIAPGGQQTPTEILQGTYQLEVRRAVDYASNISASESAIGLFRTYDTNFRLIQVFDPLNQTVNGNFGDQNHERHQGNIQIEQNIVTNALNVGILVDNGVREGALTFPGGVRNFNAPNVDNLAPGVVLTNNVVANYGQVGIRFSGDANPAGEAAAISPFGRIMNNTVYGGASANGIGIEVTNNAAPTLLNNIVSNATIGIAVDASSNSKTVVGSNLFKGNTNNGKTTDSDVFLAASAPLFVDPAKRNFYLAAGSRAVDSAVNKLDDRSNLTALKADLALALSNIEAPQLDLYGQKRVDDPSQLPLGTGNDIFKDRGAIERADFVGPSSKLIEPLDNDTSGNDRDPNANTVKIDEQNVPRFVLKLSDNGIGIDDLAIVSSQFTITKDGVDLIAGTDYSFVYNANTDEVTFLPATGAWEINKTYVITIDNSVATGVKDTAGNRMQANLADGSTKFTIFIGTLLDFGDAPATYGTLKANNGASHKVVSEFYLGAGVSPEVDGQPSATANADDDDGLKASTFTTINNSSITVTSSSVAKLDMWIDLNRDGDFLDANEKISPLASFSLVAGAGNTFTFALPTGTTSGVTMARLRMSSAGIASPVGLAEDGEVEDYQITVTGPQFQNPSGTEEDVNNDGFITALDALIVINYINRYGSVSLPSPTIPTAPPYLDVNGNGVLEAGDALFIINYLNANAIQPSEGEGEGEAPASFATQSSATSALVSDDSTATGYFQVPDTLYASSSVVIESRPIEVDASAVASNALNGFVGPIAFATLDDNAWNSDELFSALGGEEEDLLDLAFDVELADQFA